MVTCPRCGTEVSTSTREWDYSAFHVKRFDCKKCDKSFKAYYREGKLSHTMHACMIGRIGRRMAS